MARLRAYPRERATPPEGTLDYQLRDTRLDPPDERPKVIATEHMWWRSNLTLGYAPGREVPEEELPLLISDSELREKR